MLDRLYLLQELDRRLVLSAGAASKAEALYEKLLVLMLTEMPLEEAQNLRPGPKASLRSFITTDVPLADLKKLLKQWDPHWAAPKGGKEAEARRALLEVLDRLRDPASPKVKAPKTAKAPRTKTAAPARPGGAASPTPAP